MTNASGYTVGTKNPFRYRGYYHDAETGLYYLNSRYYNPEWGRFISADGIISVEEFRGTNLFHYCDNNPIMEVDYCGYDGQLIEIGKGWWCRVDPENTGTGTKRHIHIWKAGKSYAQNEDGSPHDSGKNSKGSLDYKINELLKKKTGWDYNEKRENFYNKTECVCRDDGAEVYRFANGITKEDRRLFSIGVDLSIANLERIYSAPIDAQRSNIITSRVWFSPIFGHISAPVFSFSMGFTTCLMIA